MVKPAYRPFGRDYNEFIANGCRLFTTRAFACRKLYGHTSPTKDGRAFAHRNIVPVYERSKKRMEAHDEAGPKPVTGVSGPAFTEYFPTTTGGRAGITR